jgi:type II secretory pathway pseudopilin PulG
MTLALAVIAIISALTLPAVGQWVRTEREDVTRAEMEGLVGSCLRFYEDTGVFPPSLAALVENDPATAGWKGPYHGTDANLGVNAPDDALKDAWGKAYVFMAVDAYNGTIHSHGPDGVAESESYSSGDDILVFFNVHEIARKQTDRELDKINKAISLYNKSLLNTHGALSTDFAAMMAQLQATGLIDNTSGALSTDGWGQAYITGSNPVHSAASLGSPDPGTVSEEEGGEAEGGGKVTICHIPPGNPNNAHDIQVSQNSVPAHLAHGDTVGPCPHGQGNGNGNGNGH